MSGAFRTRISRVPALYLADPEVSDLLVHRLARAYLLPGKKKPTDLDGLFEKLSELTTESVPWNDGRSVRKNCGGCIESGFHGGLRGRRVRGNGHLHDSRGLFIRLGDYPIDGFLPLDELPSANFEMDSENMRFVESGTKRPVTWGGRYVGGRTSEHAGSPD